MTGALDEESCSYRCNETNLSSKQSRGVRAQRQSLEETTSLLNSICKHIAHIEPHIATGVLVVMEVLIVVLLLVVVVGSICSCKYSQTSHAYNIEREHVWSMY